MNKLDYIHCYRLQFFNVMHSGNNPTRRNQMVVESEKRSGHDNGPPHKMHRSGNPHLNSPLQFYHSFEVDHLADKNSLVKISNVIDSKSLYHIHLDLFCGCRHNEKNGLNSWTLTRPYVEIWNIADHFSNIMLVSDSHTSILCLLMLNRTNENLLRL